MNEGRKLRLRAPSPAMIVALVALVFAMSGTAVAASKLVNGDKLIKKNSLSGNRLRVNTVTGNKVKVSTLGKVPSATAADTATTVADGAITTAKIGSIPGARVRHANSAITTTSGATAVLTWDTVDFNVGGVWDASKTNRLTAPVAGRYLIVASVRWTANTTGRRTIAIEVNGTSQIARSNISAYWTGGGDLAPEQAAQTIYKLNAGDYVEVWAYQDSAVNLDLLNNVDNGIQFSMEWLAPS